MSSFRCAGFDTHPPCSGLGGHNSDGSPLRPPKRIDMKPTPHRQNDDAGQAGHTTSVIDQDGTTLIGGLTTNTANTMEDTELFCDGTIDITNNSDDNNNLLSQDMLDKQLWKLFSKDQKWDYQYQLLVKFMAEHKHVKVPRKYTR